MKRVQMLVFSAQAAPQGAVVPCPPSIIDFSHKITQQVKIFWVSGRERWPAGRTILWVLRVCKPSLRCYFASWSKLQPKETPLWNVDMPGSATFHWIVHTIIFSTATYSRSTKVVYRKSTKGGVIEFQLKIALRHAQTSVEVPENQPLPPLRSYLYVTTNMHD